MFSCEYCEIFTSTYFEEYLRKTASSIFIVAEGGDKNLQLNLVKLQQNLEGPDNKAFNNIKRKCH